MKNLCLLFVFTTLFSTCKSDEISRNLNKISVDFDTHQLEAYLTISDKEYYLIFESGLGDGASLWLEKNVITELQKEAGISLYDRGGYERSGQGPSPRNIPRLSSELAKVITATVPSDKKVILVAHSLGAFIVRDYTVKNPNKVAGIIFVDPSHEAYNRPSQELEDFIFEQFKATYGVYAGATAEARELLENTNYMDGLANLPNIPVTVITSVQISGGNTAADRQAWYDAHEQLKKGITNFEHIKTTNSGHYIQREQPALVIEQVKNMLSKL